MSDPTNRRLVSRRAAARALVAGVGAVLVAPRALLSHRAPLSPAISGAPLRIGLARSAGDGVPRSFARGIRLGVDEASRAATMLGRQVALREGAARDLLDGEVDALVGGGMRDCGALASLADAAGVVYVDGSCGPSPAAHISPRPHVFHIVPAEETRLAALARASMAGEVVLWHPALRRFGAAQLNARYRDRFDEPMDSHAWAGWMAVKALWESSSRLDLSRGETLAAWLASPRARFDGHKGRALYFDPGSHELRQPLYVVPTGTDAEAGIEEVPPTESTRSAAT